MQQESPNTTGKSTIHYAWIIALSGLWVTFAAIGLGRFSWG
jgi:hypothetical protein